MAVAAGDAAILIVDAEFGALIAADFATPINSFPLGVRMYARASCSTRFTSHPPFGFGTTWWDFGPLPMSCAP